MVGVVKQVNAETGFFVVETENGFTVFEVEDDLQGCLRTLSWSLRIERCKETMRQIRGTAIGRLFYRWEGGAKFERQDWQPTGICWRADRECSESWKTGGQEFIHAPHVLVENNSFVNCISSLISGYKGVRVARLRWDPPPVATGDNRLVPGPGTSVRVPR